MSFTAPLWLLGLLPWTAAALYLLLGKNRRVVVPFLELWPKQNQSGSSRRKWRLTPALAAALAAMFLGIVAAAGPQAQSGASRTIKVIVDRGPAMSARSGSGTRYDALLRTIVPEILRIAHPETLEIVMRAAESTLAAQAQNAIAANDSIIVLLSDQPMTVHSDRLVQIVPTDHPENIGISALTIRTDPVPQAMVSIVATETAFDATLTVTGAKPLAIHAAGDYFVDLPAAPREIIASIAPGGDAADDDRATATWAGAWPVISPQGSLPAELQRMIDVYSRHRSATGDSPVVTIGSSEKCDVILAAGAEPSITGPVEFAAGLLTEGIHWPDVLSDAQAATAPPSGFEKLVWCGDTTLLAVRGRQLWVGFRSQRWAASPDFVLFWGRALDWVNPGPPHYVSTCAPVITFNAAPAEEWRGRLRALASAPAAGAFGYSSWMLVAAVGCLLMAAMARK